MKFDTIGRILLKDFKAAGRILLKDFKAAGRILLKDFQAGRILLLLAFSLVSCSTHQNKPQKAPARNVKIDDLHTGDLIFLDLNCGEICDAIETVTKQQFEVAGPNLSHVGVIWIAPTKEIFVYEAWPEGGVKKTPLPEVIGRVDENENQPHGFFVGRFRPKFRGLAENAAAKLERFLGKPYNDTFVMDNGKYYCSQLVYESFRNLKTDNPIFLLAPMFFGTPPDKSYQTWDRYYHDVKAPMPTGKPGISPLGIYLQGRKNNFFK